MKFLQIFSLDMKMCVQANNHLRDFIHVLRTFIDQIHSLYFYTIYLSLCANVLSRFRKYVIK